MHFLFHSYFSCSLFSCIFFSLLFSTMPNFNADIFVWSWLVSFPHLLHPSFSYLKYPTDFDLSNNNTKYKNQFPREMIGICAALGCGSILALAFCLYLGTSLWKMKARNMIMQLCFLSPVLKSKQFKAYQFGFLGLYATGFVNKIVIITYRYICDYIFIIAFV